MCPPDSKEKEQNTETDEQQNIQIIVICDHTQSLGTNPGIVKSANYIRHKIPKKLCH